MKITFISDTHGLHDKITKQLVGGNILIHSGDFMNSGYYKQELIRFCKWFDEIDNYDHKIFIAGNHDRLLENEPEEAMKIINSYKTINYLQDDWIECDGVKIYGSPWQPEFYNWAFNLPRGEKLRERWNMIPNDVDILITHGPAYGHGDECRDGFIAGCKDLLNKIREIKPKIHAFGHIHEGYGITYEDIEGHKVKMINASVLSVRYEQVNKPTVVDY